MVMFTAINGCIRLDSDSVRGNLTQALARGRRRRKHKAGTIQDVSRMQGLLVKILSEPTSVGSNSLIPKLDWEARNPRTPSRPHAIGRTLGPRHAFESNWNSQRKSWV
jgi:hypothetical protein